MNQTPKLLTHPQKLSKASYFFNRSALLDPQMNFFILSLLVVATLSIDTRERIRNTNSSDAQNVTVGALESSLDLLLRYQNEISKEKEADANDEALRATDCNNTRAASLQTIASAKQAEGDLIDTNDYVDVLSSLDSAIKTVRTHYLNATEWTKRATQIYVHTTQELEQANSELQNMQMRHDGVTGVLKDLVARVTTHKEISNNNEAPLKIEPTFLQLFVQRMKEHKLHNQKVNQLVTSLLETTKQINETTRNSGWHEEVIRLSHSITDAVGESKTLRIEPLQLIVNDFKAQLRRDGIEMKRATHAKSISSEALLTAKHSKSIIEARSIESDAKRIHFNNVTATAFKELNEINTICDKGSKEWNHIDGANGESLETIQEFVGMLSQEKREQESKLEQAVAMMDQ